jgi:LmbE family N-acetylglucosaminyl deacetylase
MKRMLCVFAHPDDECLGPGGTIAQCVLEGGEVFVTTFTAGEAGSIGISKTLTREELGKRRRAEMAAAAAALGVGNRILGVPDKGVKDVDEAWAVDQIVQDIRRFRPQIVMTFHHLGVSGHPDHIAVAHYLDLAFAQTPDGPSRYFGFGLPTSYAALYQRPNLVPIPDHEIAAVVPISDAAMDRKIAAIRAHETQYAFFQSLEAMFNYRDVARPEHFALHRWHGPRPAFTAPMTDLWDGMGE